MNKTVNKIFVILGVLYFSSLACGDCSSQEKLQMSQSGMTDERINVICGADHEDVSNICKTRYKTCRLKVSAKVGQTCWCVTENGPKSGLLIKK